MNTSPNCCAESPIAVSGVGCSIILPSTNISSGNVGSHFSDIHVPRSVIENLRLVTSIVQIRADAFKYGVLSRNRVPGALLYGPPGTGKTLLAKSLSRQPGLTMLEVTSADVNNMYASESEKTVRAIFTLAHKLRPCIVFIDEADAIFSSRATTD
jgi:SpoVK/Ycf46/Vps4 family AAA+-type ATPase